MEDCSTNIVERHLSKAVERLRAAEKLLIDGYYEDAVSRAYYAMYHAAMAALATLNVFPRTHEGVVSEFGRRFVLTGIFQKELGRILAEVKATRETYEYTVVAEASRSEAENILSKARFFVEAVKDYIKTYVEGKKSKPASSQVET